MVAVALAAVMAMAAQCEGKTQKGERCKREAAEGSKFCIGHADQAKKPVKTEAKEKAAAKQKTEQKADAEQKTDDTCWAVTEAGTRCKHKRDGESDYCKQHAPSVKPSKPVTQCRAMTADGKQCSRKPEEGKRYCKQHGAK
jgi:hypothetical protein